MDYLRCSEEDFNRHVDDLYIQIVDSGYKPDSLIGIGSGGFVVLTYLLDRFRGAGEGRPYIPVIASLYNQLGKPGVLTTNFPDIDVSGDKVLITDDVADTGETLNGVKGHYIPRAIETRVATVHRKPQSIVIPDYCAAETDRWIIYPWGTRETTREIIEARLEKGLDPLDELRRAGITRSELKGFNDTLTKEDAVLRTVQSLLERY